MFWVIMVAVSKIDWYPMLKKLIGHEIDIESNFNFKTLIQMNNTNGFYPVLFEKDFRLTIILIYLSKEMPELIFKGGCCLNKMYYPYYRLSEDLDFTLPIDEKFVNSDTKREKFFRKMEHVVKKIELITWYFVFGETKYKKAERLKKLYDKEYTYLRYILHYDSFMDWSSQQIKIEFMYTPKQYFKSVIKDLPSFLPSFLHLPLKNLYVLSQEYNVFQ